MQKFKRTCEESTLTCTDRVSLLSRMSTLLIRDAVAVRGLVSANSRDLAYPYRLLRLRRQSPTIHRLQ